MQSPEGQSPTQSVSALALSPDQQSARYRPWEQKDLLSRLRTFKPRTWFGKPLQVNAVSCARHGWINSGPDTLKCEVMSSCIFYLGCHQLANQTLTLRCKCFSNAVLRRVPRPAHSAKVVMSASAEGEDAVVRMRQESLLGTCSIRSIWLQASKEYADRLVSGHAESCPWRNTVCDPKLEKFPKLPARDVYIEFVQRYERLDGLSHLPPLSQQPVDSVSASHRCCVNSLMT